MKAKDTDLSKIINHADLPKLEVFDYTGEYRVPRSDLSEIYLSNWHENYRWWKTPNAHHQPLNSAECPVNGPRPILVKSPLADIPDRHRLPDLYGYEYTGEYREPVKGDVFLSDWNPQSYYWRAPGNNHHPLQWDDDVFSERPILREVVEPVESSAKRPQFPGFYYTGELRLPKQGEYYLLESAGVNGTLSGYKLQAQTDHDHPNDIKRYILREVDHSDKCCSIPSECNHPDCMCIDPSEIEEPTGGHDPQAVVPSACDHTGGSLVNPASGGRTFETGSVRDSDEGKGIPSNVSPIGILRLAKQLQRGANKYAKDNWRKGQPFTALLDSIQRHILKYTMGSADEDHLAAVAFGVFALMEQEHRMNAGDMPGTLDDRFPLLAPSEDSDEFLKLL